MPIGGFRAGIMGASGTVAAGGGLSSESLDFEVNTSDYLSMSAANFGSASGTDVIFSCWYKRESTGTMMLCGDLYANTFEVSFTGIGKILATLQASSTTATFQTVDTFTDTASWHHLYVKYDSTESTASDRFVLYHDGTHVTSVMNTTYPTASESFNAATSSATISGLSDPYDGLLYDAATFVGTLPTAATLYDSGTPPDISEMTGLHSQLSLPGGTAEADWVLATDWTNEGAVVASATIPT